MLAAPLDTPPAIVIPAPMFIEVRHVQVKDEVVKFIGRMQAAHGYRPRDLHALTLAEAKQLGIVR